LAEKCVRELESYFTASGRGEREGDTGRGGEESA
jgi:hypothetical protein